MIYDAEHFFDGWRADARYALQCLRAAADAGAETRRAVRHQRLARCRRRSPRRRARSCAELGDRCRIGIHPHDDAGCGVANALVAVEAGALQVQGTTNGVGERTGNANLTTIIANLALKMGHEVLDLRRSSRS